MCHMAASEAAACRWLAAFALGAGQSLSGSHTGQKSSRHWPDLEHGAIWVVGRHGDVLEHVQALGDDGEVADEEAGVEGARTSQHGLHHAAVRPLLGPYVWEAAAPIHSCRTYLSGWRIMGALCLSVSEIAST